MDPGKLVLVSLLFATLNINTLCLSRDTIGINETLREGEVLVSAKSNFALGFFSPGNSRSRYIGIWFHKVSKQTVVWVANRNELITGLSGVLKLNQHGDLMIYDSNEDQESPIWSTTVLKDHQVTRSNCVAQLLDSGNFVVSCGSPRSRRILWQSFDYPANTALPRRKHGLNKRTGQEWTMNSWKSRDDPGTGNYWLKTDANGSPQVFLYNGTKRYWRSDPWPWTPREDVYNYTFVNNEEEASSEFYQIDDSVLVWIVLDESGYLRRLTWNEKEGNWREFWSAPKFRCESYGWCGSYGVCDATNAISFECSCLPGYEPRSKREWFLRDGSGGCVRKREDSSSICGSGEGFVEAGKYKLPDTSGAVWIGMSMSKVDCERACLRNCSCSAYASIDFDGKQSGCLAWFGELKDVVDFQSHTDSIYVRVDARELAEIARRSSRANGPLTILLVSVGTAWFVLMALAYLWCRKWKKRAKRKLDRIGRAMDKYKDSLAESNLDLKFFSLAKIRSATNNFSPGNKLGQGGFGTVYKGRLSGGNEVAIKRLSKDSGQGIEEFKNEIMLIAKLQHRNLVKLLGCCIQGKEKILVYEYLSNRSLDMFLFDKEKRSVLDWRKRFDIIVGIARAIVYLHHDSRLRIIHRDLKTSNILLDSHMNPKISDFGMAKTFSGDQLQDKTKRVVGSYGYMSPEYVVFGRFSVKSDVFSYGVILLEIITGKKNNGWREEDISLTLMGLVWELWREDRVMEVVDSTLKESCNSSEIARCVQVGLLCVQEDPVHRPIMPQVLLMLNSGVPLPCPNHPAYVFNRSCKRPDMLLDTVRSFSQNEITVTEVLTR